MNRAADLTGRKFGKLTVIRRSGKYTDGSALWLCRCVCGTERVAVSNYLRRGRTIRCTNRYCRDSKDTWTREQERQLKELYPTTDTNKLAHVFGRSAKAVASRAKVLGIKKAIGHGGRVEWTAELDSIIREYFPETLTSVIAAEIGVSTIAVHSRAHKLGIRKTPEHVARTLEACGRAVVKAGVSHRFQKGIIPNNKGTRRPGWHRGRMRETQFKKGQEPHNTLPLWTFRWVNCGSGKERGSGTAYMMLKTGKPGPKPYGGWEWVHKLIWEQAHGPIPEGFRIWWKDGDHANNSLSNLELVSARDHMMRTTVHNFPAPLVKVIQLAGALKRKINRRERQSNEEHA